MEWDSDERIYHYTNQTGLLGIVKTRELWASKIQCLNDTTEFRHGLNHIRYILKQREAEAADPIERNYIAAIWDHVERWSMLNVFVVSFSGSPDLLSQWRAYSKNELGYALGFGINRLRRLASKQGFNLEQCIYDTTQQQKRAGETVDHHLEYFRTLRERFADPESIEGWTQNLIREFFPHVCALAPLFKDHSFSEEREWRLISVPKSSRDKEYNLRPGRNFLIPYYSFSLVEDGKFTIDDVIVGPSPEKDLALSGAFDFLIRNEVVLGNGVQNSRIPFRSQR